MEAWDNLQNTNIEKKVRKGGGQNTTKKMRALHISATLRN